jgi:hypothetical protein
MFVAGVDGLYCPRSETMKSLNSIEQHWGTYGIVAYHDGYDGAGKTIVLNDQYVGEGYCLNDCRSKHR